MTDRLEQIKRIRRLEIGTKKLVKELFSGAWASIYKGYGIEPEDLRVYEPLDPIRFIDWHVTAKAGKPYVRLFKEERQLSVLLAVDLSASTNFGKEGETKRDKMAEMGALIAFSALENGDKVGMLLFTSILEKYLPPKPGSFHILPLIQDLLYFKPTRKGTDMKLALDALARLQPKRCALFLISDFLFQIDKSLLSILAKKHDLVAICLNDPVEKSLPDLGWLRVQDLEKGNKMMIDTSKNNFQKNFPKKVFDMIQNNRVSIEKAGGTFIQMSTEDSPVAKLVEFFAKKKVAR